MNNRKTESQNIPCYICEEMCNLNHSPSKYYLIRVRETGLSGMKLRVQLSGPQRN